MSAGRVGRVVVALLVVLLVGAPVVFAGQMAHEGPRPHEAVLTVSGPVMVAQAVAERAESLPGHPFDARVLPEGTSPAAGVADGSVQVGLVVDFTREHDVLAVSSTADTDLVKEYEQLAAAVAASYGRTLVTREVPPTGADDAARGLPYLLTFLWVFVGLGLAVGLSLWRGPVAATFTRGVGRLAALGGAGLVVGVLVAVVAPGVPGDETVGTALLGALVVVVTSWSVLALESVLGLSGLALGSALFLGASAPLLTLNDPTTLPMPWSQLSPWTVHGSALQLARDHLFFGQHDDGRSWAVLLAWATIAVVGLVGARLVRPPTTYVRADA